jgi:hypothetical protein
VPTPQNLVWANFTELASECGEGIDVATSTKVSRQKRCLHRFGSGERLPGGARIRDRQINSGRCPFMLAVSLLLSEPR